MKLVRSGSPPPGMKKNSRVHDLAQEARKALEPILGEALAADVANNAAMAFAFDEDEIYEPDMSFADAVRSTLVQRLRHPKTYQRLTSEMLEEAVMAIKNMDSDRLGKAVMDFFTAPINEHDTPYVSMPEDFTPAEQTEFVELVRQPRFVSRDEQIDKLKEIIARRRATASARQEARGRPWGSGPRPSDWVTGRHVKNGRIPGYDAWLEPPDDDEEREECSHCGGEGVDPRWDTKCSTCGGRGWVHEEPEDDDDEEIEENPRRASTLNGRPSMDTSHVGHEVDPDRYTGARGKHLESAMDRYETFHAKRPLRTVELPHDLPTSVVPVGQVISTMYRTDKWHEDGDDEDYKHVHDDSRGGKDREYEFGKGVIAYEPANQVGKSVVATDGKRTKAKVGAKSIRLPVQAPKALSLLGYCLGVFVQRFDDQEIYELNPRGCYLFCSPKGDMLALHSPDKQPDGSSGFLMIMAGGGLRVLKDGIDG